MIERLDRLIRSKSGNPPRYRKRRLTSAADGIIDQDGPLGTRDAQEEKNLPIHLVRLPSSDMEWLRRKLYDTRIADVVGKHVFSLATASQVGLLTVCAIY